MIQKIIRTFLSRDFFLYVLFGGLATIIDWGSFVFSNSLANFHYISSVVLSFSLGSITNFSLNKYLNFKNKSKKLGIQFGLYLIIALTGLIITILLMWVLIEKMNFLAFPARAASTVIILIYNFLGHKFVTFRLIK